MALDIETGGVISFVNRTHFSKDGGLDPDVSRKLEIEQAMRDLRGDLAEPVYEGYAETALVHHLGKAAFQDSHSLDHLRFSRMIRQERDADPAEHALPVLISYTGSRKDDITERQTALVVVETGDVTYRSEYEHKRNIEKAGFAGKVAATTRTLTLLGPTTTVDADLVDWGGRLEPIDPCAQVLSGQDGLVLSKRTSFDGRNGDKPTKNDPDASRVDQGVSLYDGNYALGWENIAITIGRNLRAMAKDRQKSGNVMSQTLKINQFFDQSGYSKDLLKTDPNLKAVLDGFLAAYHALGQLGQRDQEMGV